MIFPMPIFSPKLSLPKVLTYVTRDSINAAASATADFGTVSIGTAATGRRILVSFQGESGDGVGSTLTVGGVSATILANIGVNNGFCSLWIVTFETGTSANITGTTTGGGYGDYSASVWNATGLANNTPVDTGTSSAAAPTDTLSTVAGGFIIAAANHFGTGATTWTNATERNDALGGSAGRFSAADNTSVTGSSVAVTATFTGPSFSSGCFASF